MAKLRNLFGAGWKRNRQLLRAYLPTGWPALEARPTTGKLANDLKVLVEKYFDRHPEMGLVVECPLYVKLTDDKPFTIPLVMRDRAGVLYGVFVCYSESGAQRYAYFRDYLAQEPGWGGTMCLSTHPVPEVAPTADLTEESLNFVHFFRVEKEMDIPEGNYALWWPTEDEPYLAASDEWAVLEEIQVLADGFNSVIASLLLGGWRGEQLGGRAALPREGMEVPIHGPENKVIIVSFSERRGIQFLCPIERVDPAYRRRLQKFYLDFVRTAMIATRAVDADLPRDPFPEDGPTALEWMRELKHRLLTQHGGVSIIMPFMTENAPQLRVPGETFSAAPPPRVDRVYPRLIHRRDTQDSAIIRVAHSYDQTDGKGTIYLPFIGDLLISFGMDHGRYFTYLSREDAKELGIADDEELLAKAVANMNDLAEQPLRMELLENETASIQLDGNFEACLMLDEEFWHDLEEELQPDLIVAVPCRGTLLVNRLYQEGAVDSLREYIDRYQREAHSPVLSREVYHRVGPGNWRIID